MPNTAKLNFLLHKESEIIQKLCQLCNEIKFFLAYKTLQLRVVFWIFNLQILAGNYLKY